MVVQRVSEDIISFKDDKKLTFPQANNFTRIVDLLDKLYLHKEPLTNDQITSEYTFTERQTVYYVSAGVYLGLVTRSPEGKGYTLTDTGRKIMGVSHLGKSLLD